MKRKNKYLSILVAILLSSCMQSARDYSLSINNLSSDTIYIIEHRNDSLTRFSLSGGTKSFYTNWTKEILPHQKRELFKFGKPNEAWREYVKEYCKDGKLRLWVFDNDTLKKYTWKQVIEENRYKSKYLFSYDTLENHLHWKIVYDPNMAIK